MEGGKNSSVIIVTAFCDMLMLFFFLYFTIYIRRSCLRFPVFMDAYSTSGHYCVGLFVFRRFKPSTCRIHLVSIMRNYLCDLETFFNL